MEVGLGPGDFVLYVDPSPLPKKGSKPLNFRPMFTVAKRLDGTLVICMEVGLIPGDFVLDGDPSPLNFRPMFIIAIAISLEHCTFHNISD